MVLGIQKGAAIETAIERDWELKKIAASVVRIYLVVSIPPHRIEDPLVVKNPP